MTQDNSWSGIYLSILPFDNMEISLVFVTLILFSNGQGLDITKEKFVKTIQELTLKIDQINGKYFSLENELAKVKSDYADLRSEHLLLERKFENQISKLKSENNKIKSEIATLKSGDKNPDGGLLDSVGKEDIMMNSNRSLAGRYAERMRKDSIQISTYPIAFSAWMNGHISNLRGNQEYVFDHAVLNSGNHYSTSTGTFTAPVSGIYAFYSTLLTLPHGSMDLESELVHNGDVFCRIYAADDKYYGSGSNMALIQLAAGDKVFVRAHAGHTGPGLVIDGPWTTFTGFLLYETD